MTMMKVVAMRARFKVGGEFYQLLVVLLLAFTISCSMLADLALDQVVGGQSKGGINTELIVGDKEQTLGTNQEVKADNIGKVVGTSDNSIVAAQAKQVTVTNNTFPAWGIGIIILLGLLVGWLSPRPKAWKKLIGNSNDN